MRQPSFRNGERVRVKSGELKGLIGRVVDATTSSFIEVQLEDGGKPQLFKHDELERARVGD